MIYLIGVNIKDRYGLYVDEEGSFIGSENKEQAIGLLPDYRENHARGYEASMSAVIYQMSFGICLLSFKDMEEVKNNIDPNVKKASNNSGSVRLVYFKEGYEVVVEHNGKMLPDDMKQNIAQP